MILMLIAIHCLVGVITEALYYNFGTSEYEKMVVGYGAAEVIIPGVFGITWPIIRGIDVFDNYQNRIF